MKSFYWRDIDLQAFLGFIAMGILLVAAIFAFGFWYFNKDYVENNKKSIVVVISEDGMIDIL